MDKALQDKLRDEAEHTGDTKPISGRVAVLSLVVLVAVAQGVGC
jgi:hypothetical protein